MRRKILLLTVVLASALVIRAQHLSDGDISWGIGGADLGSALHEWTPGQQVNEDDNFFISRVKPKARFRNAATQVMDTLQTIFDKKLICWLPINNTNESNWNRNALPDGIYDSEVFSMWSYVTHWGDWTAPNGRVPGALLDVAHKNGVGVSGLASVPNAALSTTWASCFSGMVSAGAEKTAKFMTYYGVDGLGYNSEWSETGSTVSSLMTYHGALVKKMRETNPLFENFWYTGTSDGGSVNWAGQLGTWNQNTFGNSENIRTSLFLNYNWNYNTRIRASQTLAKNLGRDPLDLYAGWNMQGGEPAATADAWALLGRSRYSIGLWGAHSSNMFFESRHEKGSDPSVKQATYLMRTERWFTGGTRNPANCPAYVGNCNYNADNVTFHGMAKMMSARSALNWNLSEEPFITYFNLGNGKFFNWQGVRQHDGQWYNIGVQDYLPTWRYWFATKLLGRTAADVPSSGLDAEFNWDDAYVGGSTMHVYGTVSNEYLHLFKTQFALQEGDVVTFRYKLAEGSANANLVLTAEGAESTPINESDYNVLSAAQEADKTSWVTKQFTVGGGLAGKTLALVALHFTDAQDLDLYLGEFSIVRGSAATPAKPELTKSVLLNAHAQGADAKLIWNMANSKAAGEPCYNLDVNTAFFKLYAQQEGKEPVYMGMTTSWAGVIFCAPMDFAAEASRNVRFGVSAVALDHRTESEIAWSDYTNINDSYDFSDEIATSKTLITQDEVFTISYTDPNHESGHWKLTHEDGTVAFEGDGTSVTIPGFSKLGNYTLELTGVVHSGSATTTTRTFEAYITVNDAKFGRLPEINSLTANGEEAGITVEKGTDVQMAYTGRYADGGTSQAVSLNELNFGFNVGDAGLATYTPFSLAFWLKINRTNGSTQFFSVANKAGSWPLTDWGWNWSTLGEDGSLNFTYRRTNTAERPATSQYTYGSGTMPIGAWTHVAIVFDHKYDGTARHMLYINGKFVEPASININSTAGGTAVTGQPDTYYPLLNMEESHYMSIGGPASGRAGIDGIIDNFQLYKKALSEAEVARSMEPMAAGNLPSGVILWNLEGAYNSDYSFTPMGSSTSLKCGSYQLLKLEGEGRAQPHFVEPILTAGCPQAKDTSYPVLTTAEWDAPKATITGATGDSEAGSATVSYAEDGAYNVTITLTNPHGSASRTYTAITVGNPTGIGEVSAEKLRAHVVGDVVYIDFKQAGNYEAAVYNVAGQRVCAKSASISGNDRMRLALPQPGVYVVRVTRDGKPVAAVKLLRQ